MPVKKQSNRKKSNLPAVGGDISWDEAIKIVLRDASEAMRYTDIAAEISARRLKSVANPAASVATALTKSLSAESSPFVRIAKGQYALKDQISSTIKKKEADPVDSETGALRAFGMFWQRSAVAWSGKGRLLGRQSDGASDVDFCEQVGVYLLHDRDRVIYVGRAADTLFSRLKFHTTDRLGGRWDRFSWFGLRSVGERGALAEPSHAWNHSVVIDTMEALLIESLEPPLNRKRGDNFSGVEYLQVADPEVTNREVLRLVEEGLRARTT